MTVYSNDVIKFESVSAVTATPDVEVGTRRREGDEEYIYVYNACNSDILPGNGATLSAVTGYSVTLSSATGADMFVGICKHSTLTTGAYGWLMTKGFAKIIAEADNSFAAGGLVTVAADGEFALKSASTGYPAPAYGKTVAAIASGSSGYAYLEF